MSWSADRRSALRKAVRLVSKSLRTAQREQEGLGRFTSLIEYWAAWNNLRFGTFLDCPTTEFQVIQFIKDHHQLPTSLGMNNGALPLGIDLILVEEDVKRRLGPFSTSTVISAIRELSNYHKLKGWPDVKRFSVVQRYLLVIEQVQLVHNCAQIALGSNLGERVKLLSTCDSSITGLRDRTLLLVVAPAETEGAQNAFLRTHTAEVIKSEASFLWQLRRRVREGNPRHALPMQVTGEAADALAAWLDRAQIRDGPIFRGIAKDKVLRSQLMPASFYEMLRRRREICGLAVPPASPSRGT